MYATLYRPLSEEYPTFWMAKLTDITSIISYNYKKRFYQVGEFTMEIPINEPAVPFIAVDTLLFTNDGDYLYITDITENAKSMTIQGYDLKYLLAMRVTLFPEEEQAKGAYGYYVVKGSTEKCIKDIVDYNISENAPDKNRRIFGFKTGLNEDRGLSNDSYMTRLESLDEVVGVLCKNAKIGYDIVPNMTYSTFIFDVIVPTNRSDNQHDVSKVVFSEQFLNVTDLKRQVGVSSLKNALYTVNVRNNDTYVQLVDRSGAEESGVFRKETVVNVQCDVDEIQSYALKDAEDKIKVDSFEAEVQAAESYKKDWFLGDVVTFKRGGLQIDSSVVEAEVNITGESHRVKVTAGDNTPTIVERLSKNTKNFYLGWQEKSYKPKKISGNLWFYPINQTESDGIYFAYPYPSNAEQEFDPKAVDENSLFHGIVNSTVFAHGDKNVQKLSAAGFTHVRDATQIKQDEWVLNGNTYIASWTIYAGGATNTNGVLGIKESIDDEYNFFNICTMSYQDYYPLGDGMLFPAIHSAYDGSTNLPAVDLTYFSICEAEDGKYRLRSSFSNHYDRTSAVYTKLLKDIAESKV